MSGSAKTAAALIAVAAMTSLAGAATISQNFESGVVGNTSIGTVWTSSLVGPTGPGVPAVTYSPNGDTASGIRGVTTPNVLPSYPGGSTQAFFIQARNPTGVVTDAAASASGYGYTGQKFSVSQPIATTSLVASGRFWPRTQGDFGPGGETTGGNFGNTFAWKIGFFDSTKSGVLNDNNVSVVGLTTQAFAAPQLGGSSGEIYVGAMVGSNTNFNAVGTNAVAPSGASPSGAVTTAAMQRRNWYSFTINWNATTNTLSMTLVPQGNGNPGVPQWTGPTGAAPTQTLTFNYALNPTEIASLAGQKVDSFGIYLPYGTIYSGESDIRIDDLVYSDLTTLPEPASIAALGAIALPLLSRRKR
jgi:hypothetical protein